ncbi:hypothetical protein DFH28DRAFT_209903 [Melampsora americana]|nr:hypothetical protein DFH28DRAFT_209903 [Melampsora americana]
MMLSTLNPTKLSILAFCTVLFTLVRSQANDDKAICADNRVLAWITPKNLVYGPNQTRDLAHGPCYCRPDPKFPGFLGLTCPEDQGFGGVGFVYCSKSQECNYSTQRDNSTYSGETQYSDSTRLSAKFSALMTLCLSLGFLGFFSLF